MAQTSDGGRGDITKKPSNIAPIQPDRFDGFASRTEAEAYAKDFIFRTYGKNGGMDYREYGFYIYQTLETIGISKILQGPVPEAGKRAAVNIDLGLASVPRRATLIEDAHSHPRLSASGARGLTASGEDMEGVRLMRGYGEDGVRYKGFKVDPKYQGVLMRLGTPRILIYWGDSLRKGEINDGEGPQVWR